MWQDYVFAVGSLIFSIALWPSLRSSQKPAVMTSVMTSGVMIFYIITYASLHLWYAMSVGLLNGSLWIVLAVQRFRTDKEA